MKFNKEGYPALLHSIVVVAALEFPLILLVRSASMPQWLFLALSILFGLWIVSVVLFFRQPTRHVAPDENLVLASCDGKVVVVEEVDEQEWLGERVIQVSVFMSLLNVHANWYPVSGEVVYREYHAGTHLAAWHPKSSTENERMTTVVDTGRCRVLFRQIAGLVARRIVSYSRYGATVRQGECCGFIKFGSRVDIFLPVGTEILVTPGDRVRGARTPIARLK